MTTNFLLLGFHKIKLGTSSQDEQGMGLVHGSFRHKRKNNRIQKLMLNNRHKTSLRKPVKDFTVDIQLGLSMDDGTYLTSKA